MAEFGLKIATGLGDAILISAAINEVKDNYDKIYIDVNWKYSLNFKNDTNGSYKSFYLDLLKILFNDEKYIIDNSDKDFPLFDMYTLRSIGIKPVLPKYSDILCSKENILKNEKYIVITTKVRQLNKSHYNKVKDIFYKKINKLSSKYKIVILGEREVEENNEYKIHGDKKIYSIYKDIIGNVKNNVLDLTIPKLGITVPVIENIKKDCAVMRDAEYVFTFGCGGNFILSLAVNSKNAIGYRVDAYNFVNSILKDTKITFSSKLFLEYLEGLS